MELLVHGILMYSVCMVYFANSASTEIGFSFICVCVTSMVLTSKHATPVLFHRFEVSHEIVSPVFV